MLNMFILSKFLELIQVDCLQIPCRTAMRGSFPLNGTYFQVNEVLQMVILHQASHFIFYNKSTIEAQEQCSPLLRYIRWLI